MGKGGKDHTRFAEGIRGKEGAASRPMKGKRHLFQKQRTEKDRCRVRIEVLEMWGDSKEGGGEMESMEPRKTSGLVEILRRKNKGRGVGEKKQGVREGKTPLEGGAGFSQRQQVNFWAGRLALGKNKTNVLGDVKQTGLKVTGGGKFENRMRKKRLTTKA